MKYWRLLVEQKQRMDKITFLQEMTGNADIITEDL